MSAEAAKSPSDSKGHETSFVGQLRSDVYDYFIVPMTTRWYRAFLTKLAPGSLVLDVGIGTATSLIANKDLLLKNSLTVIGVDYDQHYVTAAVEKVKQAGLEKHISLVCASIHDYAPPKELGDAPFDAIYFSGSFMIIPNKVQALHRCQGFLKKSSSESGADDAASSSGKFFFTQSFEQRGLVGNAVNWLVKPTLKFVTSIDFGEVTYKDDFDKTLAEAKLKVLSFEVMAAGYFRDEVLVVAK